MRSAKTVLALVSAATLRLRSVAAQSVFGLQGAEAAPDRMQPSLLPSPESDARSHAVLFPPPGNDPFRLALIAHAALAMMRTP